MSKDLYKAPEAELLDSNQLKQDEFYIVSFKKLTILYFGTAGLYGIFWFYQQWKNYKIAKNLSIWPVARALFSFFYADRLFNNINLLKEKTQPNSEHWNHRVFASIYVVLTVFSTLIGFLPMGPYTIYLNILSLFFLPFIFWTLYSAQKNVNIALSDPNGSKNNKFSLANYFWMIIGLLIWVIVILGYIAFFESLDKL